MSVYIGNAMPSITPPTKEGYIFDGYYSSKNGSGTKYYEASGASAVAYPALSGATQIFANWKPVNYKVKYNSNGGEGSMSDSSHVYGTAKNLSANSFTRTGYGFGGWSSSPLGEVEFFDNSSVSNLCKNNNDTYNLYAVWTPITYQIKYNSNGGTGGTMSNSTHTFDTEKNLTANAFSREGYYFAGWATSSGGAVEYTDQKGVKNLSSQNGAVVNLYAKWTVISYVVRFNKNGGTGSMADMNFVYGTAQNLTTNTFTREGYTFTGWSTYSSGNVEYEDGQIALNLTTVHNQVVELYAVWERQWFAVSVVGSSVAVNYVAELSEMRLSSSAIVTPATGYYAYEVSFDNVNWVQVKSYTTDFYNFGFSARAQMIVGTYDNSLTFVFDGVKASYIADASIVVYLKFNQTPYSNLRENSGASVSGVAVSSTMGGMASILGDPYGEEPTPGEQITLVAKLTDSGYEFLGWCLPTNLSAPIYTEMSVRVDKADLIGRQIVAVFIPVSNSNVNTDLNN